MKRFGSAILRRVNIFDQSLSQRLRTLIIAAPVVIFLLVLTIVAVGLTVELQRQAHDKAQEEIRSLGFQLEKRIENVAQTARAIGEFQKRNGPTPRTNMLEYLRILLEAQLEDEIQGVYIAYEAVDYKNPNANPWYDWEYKGTKTGGYDFHDCARLESQWYCHAKSITEESYIVTGPYYDKDGANMKLVSVTLPVRLAENFLGVAGVDFKIERLGELVQTLSHGSEYAYLVCEDRAAGAGRPAGEPIVFATTKAAAAIATRPLKPEEQAKEAFLPLSLFPNGAMIQRDASGYLEEYADSAGARHLVSWEKLGQGALGSWKVVRSVPYESVWGTYDRIVRWCLWGGFPGLLLIMCLAAWLAERALGPIPLLTATAAAVEGGDYRVGALTPLAGRHDEMGQLARGFRSMVSVVSDREASLHQSKEELAGRERHFRALIEYSSDLITIIDSDAVVRFRSPSVRTILGYEPGETVGRHAPDYVHPDDRTKFRELELRQPSAVRRVGSLEYRLRHRDGSYRVLEGKYTDLRDDPDVRGIVLNSRDITGRKADEDKIRRLADDLKRERDSLEDRVRFRTAELEQKNEELLTATEATEQAMKQKDMFLDNVAHDLRTPLSVVLGYSENLYDQAVEDGLDEYAEDLLKVKNRGQDLLELVNDLLQLSLARNESKIHLDINEFDITPMLRDRLEGIDGLARKNHNAIEFVPGDQLGSMLADKVKVWRILMNLISNACKFTQAGRIRIAAERQPAAGGDRIVFRVSDTGKGMAPEQLARLFHRFSQVQGTAAEARDGVGLGLSICRMYCQVMGGKIEVESTQGQGSTFTVTLPAVVNPPRPDETSAADRPAPLPTPIGGPGDRPATETTTGGQNLVLIIDDDTLICELMRRNLEDGGFETRSAHDGLDGIRLARELQPAAIVLDVLMPIIDGWGVLAALKSDPLTAKIPVIMASILDERQRGLKMGADDYVSKPVTRDALPKLLHKHLDGRETGRLLVVEDDDDNRTRLCRLLRNQGWEVIETGDGARALDLIRERRPDLILLDLMLPSIDGFGVVEAVMKDQALRFIPIVVMTAASLGPEARSRLQGQVEQVLDKGLLDRKELLRTIRTLVREHQSRPVLQAEVADHG